MMNYFELYNLPVSLQPDQDQVKKEFYKLSRQYHPDFFSQESEEEQSTALEKSSDINKAYKTFTNSDATIKYVLQLKGLLEEEEKYQLDPEFLMEMLELNESVMDAKMDEDENTISDVKSQISAFQSKIFEPVKEIIEHYQEDITTKEELLQVKEYYYRKKYLNRILEGMEG
ncbi:MAG: chaperone protein HscB [Chitinophagaceae bacterium]|nr:chaperone protein HscB [Chitinophagaceae bacterium]